MAKKPKLNNQHGYGHGNGTLGKRQKRRERAQERAEKTVTPKQQLARLDKGGFTAAKERAKLAKK